MDIKKWSDKVKYGGMYISELEKLHEISKDKNVLEIGSMVGMSSGVIADSAKHLTCVDVWEFNDYAEIEDNHSRDHYIEWDRKIEGSYDKFIENMAPWLHKIDIVVGTSNSFFSFSGELFSVILIDGDHSYSSTLEDFRHTHESVFINGLICFHDYGNDEWPGVKSVCDYVDENPYYEFVEQVETLRIYRRIK